MSENVENTENLGHTQNSEISSERSESSPLTVYQDALLELLSSGLPNDQILESLNTDPRFERYRDYVKEFDPDMVAVACELMVKWSIRRQEA